jgi:hypothetical protein
MIKLIIANQIVLALNAILFKIFSYWNYLIIKNQLNPSLCITGVNPYLKESLTSEIESRWNNIISCLSILNYQYINMNGTSKEGTTELEVINEIKIYQEQKQQLRLYISFLKDVKHINLLY